MYKPNRNSFKSFEQLKARQYWKKTQQLFLQYQKKWNGPEIPIYIFPMEQSRFFLARAENRKSGVSFADKLFLFISPFEDEKELEALFVHEYHHTCRINKQNKDIKEFTLLDSIILEGLAEYAVEICCGHKYRSAWCGYYSKKEIYRFWKSVLRKEYKIKKDDRRHDEILYGIRPFPKMIGYGAGYQIVSMFKEKQDLTIDKTFSLPSERFISLIKLA